MEKVVAGCDGAAGRPV